MYNLPEMCYNEKLRNGTKLKVLRRKGIPPRIVPSNFVGVEGDGAMQKRKGILLLLCLILSLSPLARAEEPEDNPREWGPTRNPNASEYSESDPDKLQGEHIVAESFYLMERSTGEVLMSHNEEELHFPASATKILTALMALKFGNLEDPLTVSENAANIPEDASTANLRAGETLTLEQALYALLLPSGNDAAIAIAEYLAGDVASFVEWMNEIAVMLGCEYTRFTNPHGYHDELHVTTAKDLAIIMDAALEDETFRKVIKTVRYGTPSTYSGPARTYTNLNLHINPENGEYSYAYSIGGKTGSTSRAGYVLVEAAARDGVELIAVVLNTNYYARWSDVKRLFEYGFTQFRSITPEEIYAEVYPETSPMTISLRGFSLSDPGKGDLEVSLQAQDSTKKISITRNVSEIDALIADFNKYTSARWTSDFRAPITQGQVMGTFTFYLENGDVTYDLVATRSVAARTDAPPTLDEIEQRVLEDDSLFPPFGWDWVLPPILILLATLLALRFLLRTILRKRKGKKQIPKPKRRYFS